MHQSRYPSMVNDRNDTYTFVSEGSKGNIKKVVVYTRISQGIYNLAFGDLDEEKQCLIDSSRTNNGDRDKVLRTVAATVIDFLNHYPGSSIFIQGESPSKTRLYQMGIRAYILIVEELFDIYGFAQGKWETMKTGKNYEAFFLKPKEKYYI